MALIKKNQMSNYFVGWCGLPCFDSSLTLMEKLDKEKPVLVETSKSLLIDFKNMEKFCSFGLIQTGEGDSPYFDQCGWIADSIKKKYPHSFAAEYVSFKMAFLNNDNGSEYSEKLIAYAPKDLRAVLKLYPNSIYADSARYLLCIKPVVELRYASLTQSTYCSFMKACKVYKPKIKNKNLIEKLNKLQKTFFEEVSPLNLNCN